jgi:hypothetical protein
MTTLELMRFLAACTPTATVSVKIGPYYRDIDLLGSAKLTNDSSVTLDATALSWSERQKKRKRTKRKA